MSIATWFAHGAAHSAGGMFAPLTRTVEQTTNYAVPSSLPPIESLIELAVKGWISESALTKTGRLEGVAIDPTEQQQFSDKLAGLSQAQKVWNAVYYASWELPSVDEAFTLANRGIITTVDMDRVLQRRGFRDDFTRAAMANLRFDIPGSSDLVRFSVRHVFEPDLIARLGYNDEFNPYLDFWHKLQGLNYPIRGGPFEESWKVWYDALPEADKARIKPYQLFNLEPPTWAQAFWWSHWVLPSPTQGYEMLFRLRPNRNKAFDPPQAAGVNFSAQDLDLLLRANDYPPFYRDKLAAIAYRIPGIRFLRQLRSTDTFNQQDVTDLLLRQGYSEGDAKVLAVATERADQQARRRQIEQQSKATIGRYWELGILSDEDYVVLLVKHGMTRNDAQAALDLAHVDLKYVRVKGVVTAVHKRYIRGEIARGQAQNLLLQAGLQAERVAQYLDDWQLELSVTRKALSAGQASKAACQGLISLDDLTLRLQNLGYPQADVTVLVGEAQLCQAGRIAQAAAKLEAKQKAAERSLQQQQKAAAQAIVTARRQLAAHGSPTQLRKWYCQGHVGVQEVYSRLGFLGWPDADIARLIADCKTGTGGGGGGSGG